VRASVQVMSSTEGTEGVGSTSSYRKAEEGDMAQEEGYTPGHTPLPGVTARALVGTWKLASFHFRSLNGEVTYPFGRDAIGYYIFADSGYMSVVVSRANRATFAAGDLMGGTTEEKAKAAETYISYSGKYTIRGDQLVVNPEVASFPNWIGADQVRILELSRDELSLSTPPQLFSGEQRTAHLVWRLVKNEEEP
jgi:hypothetical protein